MNLTQAIKQEAHRLGFALAGVTTPEPPPHWTAFQKWLSLGRHGSMDYLADPRRADPHLTLPECRSIIVLAARYADPEPAAPTEVDAPRGMVASYAWGRDYHLVLPARLEALAAFVAGQVEGPLVYKAYTDTGPLLERDLAQRAGLGWIGKNTCLINPQIGSYFFLAELLVNVSIEPDLPFTADRCGECTRCIEACPTGCILPDRTLDARRCISYLTIENKGEIPPELRPQLGNRIFGCDACQQACPWNRRVALAPDPAFAKREEVAFPNLVAAVSLTPQEFNRKFKESPVSRARRRGYLRNVAVALGNSGRRESRPALEAALCDPEPLVREHARWALEQIEKQNPATEESL